MIAVHLRIVVRVVAGYADTGEYWRSVYESDTFQADLENLLQQLSPLYTQLHAYVRRKLVETYGASRFPYSGHIPAHLLGEKLCERFLAYGGQCLSKRMLGSFSYLPPNSTVILAFIVTYDDFCVLSGVGGGGGGGGGGGDVCVLSLIHI